MDSAHSYEVVCFFVLLNRALSVILGKVFL